MSGHSKWSKIKHQKGVNDAKKGALFTKLARDITIAATTGGGDIDMNFALRLAVEKAKQANMPKDNIQRAIKKGTGESKANALERISYEAYGAGGVAILIDCTTDNKNRTVSEVKKIVETHGGKFANVGSVAWQFEEKGLIVVEAKKIKKAEKFGKEDTYIEVDKEELLLELMGLEGVEDIVDFDDEIEIFCKRENLKNLEQQIVKLGIKIKSFELIKMPKDPINVSNEIYEKVNKLVEDLEEHSDVNTVWTNMKL